MRCWAVQAKDEEGKWYIPITNGDSDDQLAVFLSEEAAAEYLRDWRYICEEVPGCPTEFRIVELVEKSMEPLSGGGRR